MTSLLTALFSLSYNACHLFCCCRYVTSSTTHIGYNNQFSTWERPSTGKEQNGNSYVMIF